MLATTETNWILAGLAMGFGATLTIDLWAQLLHRCAGIGPTDWGLVGRWVAGLGRGRLRLTAVDIESPRQGERLLGWLTHYAVGIVYALMFLAMAQFLELEVSLPSALLFGAVTVLAPWLILLPALGKGWFATATPRPGATRLLNLAAHLLFGAGLFYSWQTIVLLDF
jgi:hypothetical protein